MANVTKKDTDAIYAALASGELTVQYQDKRVTYRSVEELKSALAILQSEVTPQTTPRLRRYAYKTGWNE